jgi:hypothetical protein
MRAFFGGGKPNEQDLAEIKQWLDAVRDEEE